MSNTRQAKNPPPKPVKDDSNVFLWDQFVQEATPDVEPWQMELPDGTLVTVGCPTSDQLELLTQAQLQGDAPAMVHALFTLNATKLLELTAQQPFTVRVKLINTVLYHYGMGLASLPESSASST